MKRVLLAIIVAAATLSIAGFASAHECETDPQTNEQTCHDTTVVPNWRDNYVPLFDLEDRDDPEQRRDAQRWRDEWRCGPQQCLLVYGGTSFFDDNGDPGPGSPNSLHVVFAASHCFLFEAAHDCSDHDVSHGEGVHDTHGGAIYLDVCLTPDAEDHFCEEGMEDTQAGLTVVDHNPCGLPEAPLLFPCIDEYHVVRPFDAEYTAAQMENSQEAMAAIAADPYTYVCGRRDSNCPPAPETAAPAGLPGGAEAPSL